MKTEVYSWRISVQRKAELESEARREGTSVSDLLDRITSAWLTEHTARNGDENAQTALRKRVMATVGTIRSGDPTLATRSREIVRERIARKHTEESNRSRRTN